MAAVMRGNAKMVSPVFHTILRFSTVVLRSSTVVLRFSTVVLRSSTVVLRFSTAYSQ
jgi:hypothetical protein